MEIIALHRGVVRINSLTTEMFRQYAVKYHREAINKNKG